MRMSSNEPADVLLAESVEELSHHVGDVPIAGVGHQGHQPALQTVPFLRLDPDVLSCERGQDDGLQVLPGRPGDPGDVPED